MKMSSTNRITRRGTGNPNVLSKDPATPPKKRARTSDVPSTGKGRPSRKRASVNYREMNEGGIFKMSDDAKDIGKEAEDVEPVLEEDFQFDNGEEGDNSDDEENEFSQMQFTLPHKRFAKRRFAFDALVTSKAKLKAKKNEEPNLPYDKCKNSVCVACAKELDWDSLEGNSRDIFQDLTQNGKSLHDLVRAVINEDVQPGSHGSRICQQCVGAVNKIESTYQQYRRLTENFLDTFQMGQRILDVDTLGMESTEKIPLIRYIDPSFAVIKVIDPSLAAFNALAVGFDFQLPVEKIYNSRISPADEIPPETLRNENEDGTITITFDQVTGAIEKSMNLELGLLKESEVDPNFPQIYMTRDEFASLTKGVSKNAIHVALEDLDNITSKLLLGKRIKQKFCLSSIVSKEYETQIPGAASPFVCSDCSSSYNHLHLLSNHIHSIHGAADDDQDDDNDNNCGLTTVPGTKFKTGETPTLEKPFQCEHCEKCFSEYLTLSTHVDHYHGFSRKCNIDDCSKVGDSIQDFVQHYVSHADVNFQVPTEFQAKMKVTLPCPMCSITIQGLWKYFQHTFAHDKEPRFKCPVCLKKMQKVQNFKEHLLKHHRSLSLAGEEKNTEVGGYQCGECGKCFSVLNKLKAHHEIHIPREEWQFLCQVCETPFPSESRLKLHLANVHNNINSECTICNTMFPNRMQLQNHISEEHENVTVMQHE